jgi:hypothetical protein
MNIMIAVGETSHYYLWKYGGLYLIIILTTMKSYIFTTMKSYIFVEDLM